MQRIAIMTTTCLALTAAHTDAALVGHYEFEETDATNGNAIADSAGTPQNATVANTGATGDLNVPGVIGSAYRPGAGAADHALIANGVSDFGITGNNARTVAFWFNTSSFSTGNQQFRILGIGTGAAGSFTITAENDAGGGVNRLGLRYGNGNAFYGRDDTGAGFLTDTWYHVAYVYDGTTLDLEAAGAAADGNGLLVYIDGVQVRRVAGNGNNGNQALNTAATDISIGSAFNESFSLYPGLIDDLRFYNEALSANEVAALVPEPSSLALLGLGGLLIARRRRG